ncbi:hypothetical protein AURANDRAFT_72050, partial [Aureococcus anophagefferens]
REFAPPRLLPLASARGLPGHYGVPVVDVPAVAGPAEPAAAPAVLRLRRRDVAAPAPRRVAAQARGLWPAALQRQRGHGAGRRRRRVERGAAAGPRRERERAGPAPGRAGPRRAAPRDAGVAREEGRRRRAGVARARRRRQRHRRAPVPGRLRGDGRRRRLRREVLQAREHAAPLRRVHRAPVSGDERRRHRQELERRQGRRHGRRVALRRHRGEGRGAPQDDRDGGPGLLQRGPVWRRRLAPDLRRHGRAVVEERLRRRRQGPHGDEAADRAPGPDAGQVPRGGRRAREPREPRLARRLPRRRRRPRQPDAQLPRLRQARRADARARDAAQGQGRRRVVLPRDAHAQRRRAHARPLAHHARDGGARQGGDQARGLRLQLRPRLPRAGLLLHVPRRDGRAAHVPPDARRGRVDGGLQGRAPGHLEAPRRRGVDEPAGDVQGRAAVRDAHGPRAQVPRAQRREPLRPAALPQRHGRGRAAGRRRRRRRRQPHLRGHRLLHRAPGERLRRRATRGGARAPAAPREGAAAPRVLPGQVPAHRPRRRAPGAAAEGVRRRVRVLRVARVAARPRPRRRRRGRDGGRVPQQPRRVVVAAAAPRVPEHGVVVHHLRPGVARAQGGPAHQPADDDVEDPLPAAVAAEAARGGLRRRRRGGGQGAGPRRRHGRVPADRGHARRFSPVPRLRVFGQRVRDAAAQEPPPGRGGVLVLQSGRRGPDGGRGRGEREPVRAERDPDAELRLVRRGVAPGQRRRQPRHARELPRGPPPPPPPPPRRRRAAQRRVRVRRRPRVGAQRPRGAGARGHPVAPQARHAGRRGGGHGAAGPRGHRRVAQEVDAPPLHGRPVRRARRRPPRGRGRLPRPQHRLPQAAPPLQDHVREIADRLVRGPGHLREEGQGEGRRVEGLARGPAGGHGRLRGRRVPGRLHGRRRPAQGDDAVDPGVAAGLGSEQPQRGRAEADGGGGARARRLRGRRARRHLLGDGRRAAHALRRRAPPGPPVRRREHGARRRVRRRGRGFGVDGLRRRRGGALRRRLAQAREEAPQRDHALLHPRGPRLRAQGRQAAEDAPRLLDEAHDAPPVLRQGRAGLRRLDVLPHLRHAHRVHRDTGWLARRVGVVDLVAERRAAVAAQGGAAAGPVLDELPEPRERDARRPVGGRVRRRRARLGGPRRRVRDLRDGAGGAAAAVRPVRRPRGRPRARAVPRVAALRRGAGAPRRPRGHRGARRGRPVPAAVRVRGRRAAAVRRREPAERPGPVRRPRRAGLRRRRGPRVPARPRGPARARRRLLPRRRVARARARFALRRVPRVPGSGREGRGGRDGGLQGGAAAEVRAGRRPGLRPILPHAQGRRAARGDRAEDGARRQGRAAHRSDGALLRRGLRRGPGGGRGRPGRLRRRALRRRRRRAAGAEARAEAAADREAAAARLPRGGGRGLDLGRRPRAQRHRGAPARAREALRQGRRGQEGRAEGAEGRQKSQGRRARRRVESEAVDERRHRPLGLEAHGAGTRGRRGGFGAPRRGRVHADAARRARRGRAAGRRGRVVGKVRRRRRRLRALRRGGALHVPRGPAHGGAALRGPRRRAAVPGRLRRPRGGAPRRRVPTPRGLRGGHGVAEPEEAPDLRAAPLLGARGREALRVREPRRRGRRRRRRPRGRRGLQDGEPAQARGHEGLRPRDVGPRVPRGPHDAQRRRRRAGLCGRAPRAGRGRARVAAPRGPGAPEPEIRPRQGRRAPAERGRTGGGRPGGGGGGGGGGRAGAGGARAAAVGGRRGGGRRALPRHGVERAPGAGVGRRGRGRGLSRHARLLPRGRRADARGVLQHPGRVRGEIRRGEAAPRAPRARRPAPRARRGVARVAELDDPGEAPAPRVRARARAAGAGPAAAAAARGDGEEALLVGERAPRRGHRGHAPEPARRHAAALAARGAALAHRGVGRRLRRRRDAQGPEDRRGALLRGRGHALLGLRGGALLRGRGHALLGLRGGDARRPGVRGRRRDARRHGVDVERRPGVAARRAGAGGRRHAAAAAAAARAAEQHALGRRVRVLLRRRGPRGAPGPGALLSPAR